ncbi:MAG: beta-ketoacyl-[acyl-carrier-protein] synthase II, partial [Deltaproteobacteria bacterium]|nr:beta-ketoacyl-[acyl-carrier-protein] synthase II [Deltaproteobacteria bacterium]
MIDKSSVLITGLGIVSPLGSTIDTFWDNLVNGKCGIRLITAFDTRGLPTTFAGHVEGFDPLAFMDKKTAQRSARFTQLSIAVVKQCMADAGIEVVDSNRERIGIYVGSSICSLEDTEREGFSANFQWDKIPIMTSIRQCNHAPAYTL